MNTSATSCHPNFLTPRAALVEGLAAKLAAGMKLTIFSTSEFGAPVRREITLKGVCEPTFKPDYINAHKGKWRVGTFVTKGKRSAFYLDLKDRDILLSGWGIPFLLESEKPGVMSNGIAIREITCDFQLRLFPGSAEITADKAREILAGALFVGEDAKEHASFDGAPLIAGNPVSQLCTVDVD